MTLVGFRPEKTDESVTAVETAWFGDGEVTEECHPLALSQGGAKFCSVGGAEVQRAKSPQVNCILRWGYSGRHRSFFDLWRTSMFDSIQTALHSILRGVPTNMTLI